MEVSTDNGKKGYSVLHLIDIFDVRYQRDQQTIASLQSEIGCDVTVVTSTYNDEWRVNRRSLFKNWEADFKGINIYHTYATKLPFFNTAIYIPSAHVLDRYDIMHAYGPWSYSSYLACILKKIAKTPLVMRADFSGQGYQRAKRSRFWRSLLRLQFRYADAITAFTPAEKQFLIDVGIPEEKISVIPLGIDLSKFHNEASRARSASEVAIGYMGRFAPIKGAHRLVAPLSRILKEYPDVKVIFAGPQQDKKYFSRIMCEMRPNANFSYIGPSDPLTFFDQCEIVVIPSISETAAITVKEAMAASKAIVASNIHPINSYVRHGLSGLLIDTDEEIYESCKRLIDDEVLRTNLQEKALDQSAEFSDRQMVRRIKEVYDSVAVSK
jgi:glycosyltransferase involved in cell wall biosynthesis